MGVNRRDFLRAVAAQGSAAVMAAEGKSRRPPNIVFIYADDLDFDEIGCYKPDQYPCHTGARNAGLTKRRTPGYSDPRMLTPHIDSLARGGVTFSRFYVTTALCTPSRYSALTGRYASRSAPLRQAYPPGTPAMILWNTNLGTRETNIARELKRAGYATGIVGKWHLGMDTEDFLVKNDNEEKNPFDPKVTARIRATYEKHLPYLQNHFGWDYAERIYFTNKEWLGLPRNMSPHNLEWITEGALEFMERHHRKPFFLYMPLTVPHGQYSADFLRGDPRFTAAGVLDKAPEVIPPRQSVFERLRKEGIDERNAAATWMDDSVGAILKKLEDLQVADDTLVIFASDNATRGKATCYEASRVPCVARWPRGIAPGSRIDALCANIDLAQTFLDLAGATPPDDMTTDGASLSPMFRGTAAPPRWRESLYLECLYIRGVVTGKWKYIANRPPEPAASKIRADALESDRTGKPRSIGMDGEPIRYGANIDFPGYFDHDQLYDLEADLFEQHNLAGDRSFSPVLNEMKDRLKQHIASLPHTVGEFKTT